MLTLSNIPDDEYFELLCSMVLSDALSTMNVTQRFLDDTHLTMLAHRCGVPPPASPMRQLLAYSRIDDQQMFVQCIQQGEYTTLKNNIEKYRVYANYKHFEMAVSYGYHKISYLLLTRYDIEISYIDADVFNKIVKNNWCDIIEYLLKNKDIRSDSLQFCYCTTVIYKIDDMCKLLLKEVSKKFDPYIITFAINDENQETDILRFVYDISNNSNEIRQVIIEHIDKHYPGGITAYLSIYMGGITCSSVNNILKYTFDEKKTLNLDTLLVQSLRQIHDCKYFHGYLLVNRGGTIPDDLDIDYKAILDSEHIDDESIVELLCKKMPLKHLREVANKPYYTDCRSIISKRLDDKLSLAIHGGDIDMVRKMLPSAFKVNAIYLWDAYLLGNVEMYGLLEKHTQYSEEIIQKVKTYIMRDEDMYELAARLLTKEDIAHVSDHINDCKYFCENQCRLYIERFGAFAGFVERVKENNCDCENCLSYSQG